MPTLTPNQYYPALSDLIRVDDLPEFLSFIKDGVNSLFDKMYYKDYQVSKSVSGSNAFYKLDVISRSRIDWEIPGTGIKFILNPDYTDSTISSFPITLFWEWEVMRYIRYFNLTDFSFTPEDFFHLTLAILNISEEQVIQLAMNTFVVQSDPNLTQLHQLVQDINTFLSSNISVDTDSENAIQDLMAQISILDKEIAPIIFSVYLLSNDLSIVKEKINTFFSAFIPEDIESYIRKIVTPRARVTLELSAAIEFPKTILKPVNPDGSDFVDISQPDIKTQFRFAQALLYTDTQAGVGFQLELAGSLHPQFAAIGNTGILLQIESLKLDLSKKTNIPEATADGRPDDFTGVYARAISVTLPARWFHNDATPGTSSTTLRLGGYDLLVGTGGLSGTIALETVASTITGGTIYYFDDKFAIHFPITVLKKNSTTNVIEEISVASLEILKTYLFPTGATNIPPCPIKFPITVSEPNLATGVVKKFETLTAYQQYLNSFPNDNSTGDTVPTLWKKIGGENGFRIGFNKFDITFKQNKVVSSNIKAALEIKKFVRPGTNTPVHIDIDGHIQDNGDFNLTASAAPPFPVELSNIFTYHIKSVELGKQEDDFYIGTAGSLEFHGFLKDTMGLGPIEVDRLRIYSDGSIEFQGGGSIHLPNPIVLKLGPVEITVSAIHYGSHQREYNGVIRKFNYFGFDGGISVDPLGVEIRGDGVKFYYCSDNLDNKPKPYLHIQTLYLDLTIPASSPVAIINGWLSIPEPGVSPEYAGGIKLQLPKAKISGSAEMKLMPKYPAFIIDAEIEFPAPIPLGTFAIYGFRGLLGYRYVAEKEAVPGLVSGKSTWYEYYKAPRRGINVQKFNGPNKTVHSGTPVSIGAGASLGTSFDNGTVVNIKAMVLLSIPSLFMIDGRASVISARLGLEDTKDPPFFAFIAIGDDSLELGFGADFKMPTKSGAILQVYADVQAAFFFKHQQPWYVHVGTKENPITARIVSLITLKSYVMLSAKGIEAGARGEFNFERNYGIIHVRAWAFIEVGGRISFERPQFGAYLQAEVGAEVDVKFISLGLTVGILFGVEVPKPFLIYGKFYYSVRVKIFFFKFKFSGELEVVWERNADVDKTALSPFIGAEALASVNGAIEKISLVKGVNMLSNETFDLAYIGTTIPVGFDSKILNNILPLDTYIDIKTEKGLLPNTTGAVAQLIGGVTTPAERYIDLVPPVSVVRGKPIRQVKHVYSIEEIAIKSWHPDANHVNGGYWEPYNPYKAMYPNDPNPVLNNLKIGQFQKTDGQYNTVRLLATTPFSFTEQGQPGWFTPEQYGVNSASLFCETQARMPKCANFMTKTVGHHFYCSNPNHMLYSNGVAFRIQQIYQDYFAYITNETNSFSGNPYHLTKSLAFANSSGMELILPEKSVQVGLKLSTLSHGLRIKYYAAIVGANNLLQYVNPDPSSVNQNQPFEVVKNSNELNVPVEYNHPTWRAIVKIEIEPVNPGALQQQISALVAQIEAINHHNLQIQLGVETGALQSTDSLEAQLNSLMVCNVGDSILCDLYFNILNIFNSCLTNPKLDVDLNSVANCLRTIIKLISDFNGINPNYNVLNALQSYFTDIVHFLDYSDIKNYSTAYDAVISILNYLNEKGDCECSTLPSDYTMIHEVCWMSEEDYEYNVSIPDQAAIEADANATIAGITDFIQPIWRPNTSYLVYFVLKDKVDNDGIYDRTYPYVYGFTTSGPVGYFHTHEKATYGNMLLKAGQQLETSYGLINLAASENGVVLNDATGIMKNPDGTIHQISFTDAQGATHIVNPAPHPDKYPITTLRQYIDYKRSYPNADGNLLSSKPLFYNDHDNTKIMLFFNKAYASQFFKEWPAYNGKGEVKGRLKIVIKDPREDVAIVNPPSLDTIVETVNVPQTEEVWESDENPQIPFVISQYASLYNSNLCIGTAHIIKPKSEYLLVTPKKLKPSKLYTAIVNNMFDLNEDHNFTTDGTSNGHISESREVHKFVFQTSRYETFEQQVNSYLLSDTFEGNLVEKMAIFSVVKTISPGEVEAAYKSVLGQPVTGLSQDVISTLNANYQHPFDKVIEGIFGLNPINEAISTEFNLIKNNSNQIVAILIKNPEPFNNPRIPLEVIQDTIQVVNSQTGIANLDYKVLFSKDYSQAIIMNNSLLIEQGSISFKFSYKIWNGVSYQVANNGNVVVNIPIN